VPARIEQGDPAGGIPDATTYLGFPAEHFDSAESNHDTATALVALPVFADTDTRNVVLVTNEGTLPDPAITPWGADRAPPAPPWWQTADIWVNNDGDTVVNEPDEPQRGRSDNQLFARITNRGASNASGYRVTFAFKAYTTSAVAPAVTIGSVPETGTLMAGDSRDYSIAWNLTDTFIQANFPAAFWTADHFCVVVTIEGSSGGPVASDANPSNNVAQTNFANVPMCTTCLQQVDFYMYNHLDRPARASLEWVRRSGRGTVQFAGINDTANIALAAKEYKKVTARLASDTTDVSVFDVTQRLDGEIVGGVTIGLEAPGTTSTPSPILGPTLIGVSTGGNWPLGSMKRAYDPGFYFALQYERVVHPRARLALQAGYHQFDEEHEGFANLGITNVSILGRVFGGAGTASRPFVIFGPGAYRVGSSWHGGLQAGIGLEVPITSAVALTTGATLHHVSGSRPRPQWIDGYLGFLFRFP
jgi:hypothetical protein